MRITPTQLRSQLYSVLDRVAETGEPVELLRKGVTLKLSRERPKPRTFSVAHLVPHPGTIVGEPDALVSLDWMPSVVSGDS